METTLFNLQIFPRTVPPDHITETYGLLSEGERKQGSGFPLPCSTHCVVSLLCYSIEHG
jgi:hypothetical protein